MIVVSNTSPINNLAAINFECKSTGLIPAVKPLVDNLIVQAGFWVNEPLYNRVLQLAGE